MSPNSSAYFLTNGVGYYPGHYCAYEAYSEDYYDFVALGAVVGYEGLETGDFCGFVLRSGQGKYFTAWCGRVLS